MFNFVSNFRLDPIAFWYFFSTLAQAAASFAALVAVFAVFRLQANVANVVQKYLKAKHWLKYSMHNGSIEQMADLQIKEMLKDVKESTEKQEEALCLLGNIENAESVNLSLAHVVAKPLKWWSGIFLLALTLLPFVHLFPMWLGMIFVLASVFGTVRAMCITRVFIQSCLRFG